jgi:ribosomal protein S18 acetylase RimI-like enzyme
MNRWERSSIPPETQDFQFADQASPKESVNKMEKEKTDLELFQDQAIEFLKDNNIVEEAPEGLVVDIDRIKELPPSILSYNKRKDKGKGGSYKGSSYGLDMTNFLPIRGKYTHLYQSDGNYNLPLFWINAFKDKKVIDTQAYRDWERGGKQGASPEALPLCYAPKSKEEAFDVGRIKEKKFHLGAWELKGKKPEEYPGITERVSFEEVAFAAVVYHPEYGDGERDEQGVLRVRFPNGQRREITGEWLSKAGYMGAGKNVRGEGGPYWAPRFFLLEGNYPDLQENNLLRPEDFKTALESSASKKYGEFRRVRGRIGHVTLNNVRYTLGSSFSEKNGRFRAYKISEDLGVVVKQDEQKQEELTHIFNLVSPDDSRVKIDSTSGGRRFGKRDGLDIQEYKKGESALMQRRSGESEEEFEERLQALDDFASFIRAKQELVRNAGIPLESLAPREQTAIIAFYKNSEEQKQEELHQFLRIFKERGLKTFLAFQYDPEAARKILNITKNFDIPEAAIIFEKYADVTKVANDADKKIQDFFADEFGAGELSDTASVTEEIMKRAGRILTEYAQKSQQKDTSIKNFVDELDEIKEDIITFSSIFKTAFKGKEQVGFEEVRGLDFSTTNMRDLSQEERGEMLKISRANWLPRGAAGRGVYEEFRETLDDKKRDVEFYVLKKDGKIVSFLRFEPILGKHGKTVPGHKYAGSFNVDPQYRGSAIGEAMLVNALDKEAEKSILEATVSPKIAVGTDYVEKRGFSITNVLPNYENSGETFFEITLDKEGNTFFHTKDDRLYPKERLRDMYQSYFADKTVKDIVGTKEDIPPDVIVQSFDVDRELPELLDSTEFLIRSGYVGTRYFADAKNRNQRYYVFERDKRAVLKALAQAA